MTIQSKEILEYNYKRYAIEEEPLSKFLENNGEIEFTFDSSDLHRGYQGTWLIMNNNLYLKDIYSANYTFEHLFNTNMKVFAEWYSGTITFGIGDNISHDPEQFIYEHYMIFKFDKGVVIDKNIYKRFEDEQIIDFGKYRGRKLMEVLKGKINSEYYPTLINYINELLKFFSCKDFAYGIYFTNYDFKTIDLKILERIKQRGFKFFVTHNYVAINTNHYFWKDTVEESDILSFSILFEKLLSCDISNPIIFKNSDNEIADIAESTTLINPDTNYINWALKNVNSFCIAPSIINIIRELTILKSFQISRINSTIFEYKPIFEKKNFRFSDEILEVNERKFEEKFGLKYNSEFNYYTYVDERVLIDKFPNLLGNSSGDDKISNLNESIDHEEFNKESFEKYNGSYAQDYERLSDQFIDEALEGDPDNYWNID